MDIGKDIRFGPHTLRIRKQKDGFAGIVVGQHQLREAAAAPEQVYDLLIKRCGEQTPGFIGLEGARKRFLELFPAGFQDPDYIGQVKDYGERAYKLSASEQLRTLLPAEDVATNPDAGAIAVRVMQATQLLDRYSKAKLGDILRSDRAGDFLQIAADFANSDTQAACSALNRHFHADGVDGWVFLTYFPFLWAPDRHMFLKPDFTRRFAERIGHRFQHDYLPKPNPGTYASLLHMAQIVHTAVSDLDPQDNIDIHSFMWATIDYKDSDVGPPKA